MNKILVTGSGGLLGSHICDLLVSRGYDVRAMVHYNIDNIRHLKDKVEIFKADIRFGDECLEACRGVDAIIHTAACINVDRSRRYPALFYETNVKGTMNMLEAARMNDAKLVHMSSCEVIGNIGEGRAAEDYPVKQPLSPYASSKYAAEAYCYSYQATYDLQVNVARGFNLCGPRQKSGGKGAVIPIFINKILDGDPPLIYGTGIQTRDYIDARDVSRGLLKILESKYKREIFHLCSGVEVSINELTDKIVSLSNTGLQPIHIDRRPGELMRSVGDNSKALKLLDWKPTISLEQSLIDTILHEKAKRLA